MEKKKNDKVKTTTKRKTTNRINTNKVKKDSVVKEEKNNIEKKIKIDSDKDKNSTSFNLIEVIIIMIITAVFGILIGSCVTYFKDNVIDSNVPNGFEEFLDVYDELTEMYYSDIDEEKLLEAGIKGMVDYLGDPFSSYLDYSSTVSLNEELEGEFVGMGVTVSLNENNEIYIYSMFDGSPAEEAGFQVGDIIKEINGEATANKTTEEVSYEIKGEEGTTVDITVIRNGEEKKLTLKRGRVILPSISYKVLEDVNIGYIKISLFAKNTPDQFREAMNNLIEKNVKSVIIDVRDNNGGYLSSSEEMANYFLKKDSVIYQLDTKGKIEKVKSNDNQLYDIPVAILINENSASSSEIFAAALNENLNVPLIGKKTYGKGTVQKTMTLNSGAMIKYTVQEWYTPKGNKVNSIGISPTYEIVLNDNYYKNPIEANDNQLQKAIQVLNEKK